MKGNAQRGNSLAFGSFGIKALQSKWITGSQIEGCSYCRSCAICGVRKLQNIWVQIFPDKPITKKPAEVRMGKGKVTLRFVAPVTPGRILFEVEGVPYKSG